MTLKPNLKYMKTKLCANFQLNMSKQVGEKCGKRADGDPDGRRVGRTESRTDGDPDGHHHTRRRAYKKGEKEHDNE